MAYSMENLKRPNKLKTRKKRAGRGNSSGRGTYSGKGLKGQKARSGGRRGLDRRSSFQQLIMKTPKLRGFKRDSIEIQTISLSDLDSNFKDGDVVDMKALIKTGLVKTKKSCVKVLGSGIIKKKLTLKLHYYSNTAKSAIEKVGGVCESSL